VILVLADTSVWVAHFRRAEPVLQSLVAADRMLCHPFVVLEIACGSPPLRERTIADLQRLQSSVVATTNEILALIDQKHLHASGCGAVDVALLASVLLTPEATLWTLDRKLRVLAERLGVSFSSAGFDTRRHQ
jgi:predicted nucleic acid-binding protein